MTGCSDAIVPITRVAVDRTDLDAALLARVADDLGGGVETHRLRIEERGGEYRRLMAFEPGRNIDQPRERQRMAFGKAVAAEPLDLLETAIGEIAFVAAADHAAEHLVPELVDRAEQLGRASGRGSVCRCG